MKKLLMVLAALLIFAGCGGNAEEYTYYPEEYVYYEDKEESELPPSIGRIFLFGENHACPPTLARQLEIWGDFYHNYGMRHLFIEKPHFTSSLMNRWMQADDDAILNQLADEWRQQGTMAGSPYVLDFYKTIKRDFPETIFHGTDIGHQTDSTGWRYIQLLRAEGLQGSDSYNLALENIAQFERFRRENFCHTVRAYYKPQNFAREFDRLRDQDVMAIHGMAHVAITDNFLGLRVPSMATTLRERYGDALETFNMTHYSLTAVPVRTDIVTLGDMEFEATFFGASTTRFSTGLGTIVKREFWRVEEAYEHFANSPTTGSVLPFDNFIMPVETGQVFIIVFHVDGGSYHRFYYRTSGMIWDDRPAAQEFIP
ncbi:MAG: hypothetical protein FWB74_05030 [Defluviitaleaceae bacterium]|nr:hypothetical protein [Defluviitaleaceae bacterium]